MPVRSARGVRARCSAAARRRGRRAALHRVERRHPGRRPARTSGLDGTYPPGLAVARVATLERDTGQMFARIDAASRRRVDRSAHLLVLGRPARGMPPRPQPSSLGAAKAREEGRASAAAPRRMRCRSRCPSVHHVAAPNELLRPVNPLLHRVTLAVALAAQPLAARAAAPAMPDFVALVLLYWCIQEPRTSASASPGSSAC